MDHTTRHPTSCLPEDDTCAEEKTYLKCGGPNDTVPYCLQCTDCLLECGGSNTTLPWCHPCENECVEPPHKLVGEDGEPFFVDMSELDTVETESDGRKMVSAGDVQWNEAPKITELQWVALYWGFKDGDHGNMTYQCVSAKRS